MKKWKLDVNGQARTVEVPPETPMLWVLREELGLRGTRFGCGKALCGACTIHVGGQARRSCVLPIKDVAGPVRTIEGVAPSPDRLHALQEAWVQENVPQCGYCQSGQIMSALALLEANPDPSDQDIDAAMSGNICRCGVYPRIRRAIHRAAQAMRQAPQEAP
jgi:isoquinoline 1-oxidoreductase alpha subunit